MKEGEEYRLVEMEEGYFRFDLDLDLWFYKRFSEYLCNV